MTLLFLCLPELCEILVTFLIQLIFVFEEQDMCQKQDYHLERSHAGLAAQAADLKMQSPFSQ